MSKCSKELRELLLEGLSAIRWPVEEADTFMPDEAVTFMKVHEIKYVDEGRSKREARTDGVAAFLEYKLREANNV